eukprot:758184-Hanusia_phi.AAC.7
MSKTTTLVVFLVISSLAPFCLATTGSLMRERYRTDRGCSLSSYSQTDLQPYEACSFFPVSGENKFGRILIQFGETNCQGANFILSDEGIFLSPSSDNILIRYSTKTCAEFYSHHGREWPQICNEPMGLLSNVYPLYQTLESIGCQANL